MCPQARSTAPKIVYTLGSSRHPWDTEASIKRPVLVVFYSGAFIEGSASFNMPHPSYPILNISDMNGYVTVYPNYRVNAFGILPGQAIKDSPNSDLNPGLLDQQFALKWVQKYIHYFGGDPHNVTIWGPSAGAGSVVAQVIDSEWPRGKS